MSKAIDKTQRNELICKKYLSGMTFLQVAKCLHLTRGCVAGIIRREGIKRVVIKKAKPKIEQKPKPSKDVYKNEADKRDISIIYLTSETCRFITNEGGANATYCGAKKVKGAYCKEHSDICYTHRQKLNKRDFLPR